MKVGLIGVSGARPLEFWEAFLRELGVEVALSTLPPHELYMLGKESMPSEAAHLQYLLGQVLELQRSDLVLLPGLLPVAPSVSGGIQPPPGPPCSSPTKFAVPSARKAR